MTGCCRLCGLPIDGAIAGDGPEGYCCRGCAAIDRRLDDVEDGGEDGATDTPSPGDAEATTHLTVDGMHCTACERFLERRALHLEGVEAAAANYATGTVAVGHGAAIDEERLRERLTVAGYVAAGDARLRGDRSRSSATRLLVGGFFGMMVMLWYVLFLYPHYLGAPGEALLLDPSGSAATYLELNLAVAAGVVVFYTGAPILRGAGVGIRAGVPNADLLLATAILAAYGVSLASVALGRTEVYFDVAVAVVMAVSLGDHYRERVAAAATDRLGAIADAGAEGARVVDGDAVREVPVEALEAGDAFRVASGDTVPVDGVVEDGTVAVDESLLTGDPTPVTRRGGDAVLGGTDVAEGAATASVVGEPTSALDGVARAVWSADAGSGGVARAVDRLAAVFVPLVAALAAVAVVLGFFRAGPVAAVLAGVSVLVVSCPCALGIATPMAVAGGVRRALDDDVVVTDDAVFEIGGVDVAVLDKTGTLSRGRTTVTDATWIDTVERVDPPGEDDASLEGRAGTDGGPPLDADDLAGMAAAVAGRSSHPVSRAIAGRWSTAEEPVDVEERPGDGVLGTVEDCRVAVGDGDLFGGSGWEVPARLRRIRERHADAGRQAAYVGVDGAARGVVAVEDRLRDGWRDAVAAIAERVDRVLVVTGDPAEAAGPYGDHPGIDEVYTDVRPEGKAALLGRLGDAVTMMVGDGDNDGPALAAADLGVAVGERSAIAADAADAVVLSEDLSRLPRFLDTVAATRRRTRENIGWALVYNAVGLPIAVVGLLTPLVAAAAMSASSLLVVANALRGLGDG